MAEIAQDAPPRPTAWYRDLVALARPRLAVLGLIVVVLSYIIAGPDGPGSAPTFHLVVGSLLALSGASVLNQVLETEVDARMRRTARRPLPAGRMSLSTAAAFGVALTVVGVGQLALGVNVLTAAVAVAGIVVYLAVYTPLKQRTSLATVVGAVPGAVPALMGWAAARGAIDGEGWTLFWILFLWQLPHFLAIAWMYRTDYERAGFRMLSVEDPDGASTARQVVLYGAALVPVSLVPTLVGLAGPMYFFSALALGLLYLGSALVMARRRTGGAAKRVLKVSVVYLPVLLALLAVDRAFM